MLDTTSNCNCAGCNTPVMRRFPMRTLLDMTSDVYLHWARLPIATTLAATRPLQDDFRCMPMPDATSNASDVCWSYVVVFCASSKSPCIYQPIQSPGQST